MEDQLQKLELRITELENKLKQVGAAGSSNIDPGEFKTYQKINSQLGQMITCYICRPRVCWPCWPPLCICPCGPGFCNPCACGPCIQSGSGTGSAGFSDFMK